MAKRTRRPQRPPRAPAVHDVTEALRRQDALADALTDEASVAPPPPAAGPDDSARLDAWLEEAAQRDRAAAGARPAHARVVAGAVAPDRGRFWEDHRVAWTKVVVVRLVFFGLLAVDAFRQLAHAAAYGAGGFNVPQLAWLPLGAPHREAMIAIHTGLGLAFALIAQGVAVRRLLPVATAFYAYAYFVSQLDSYQHHYLMTLVLLLWCFVPTAPEPATSGAPRTVRSWALRLVLVQLAIVYLWAAFAKVDPHWLDGATLRGQVASGRVRDLIAYLGFDTVAGVVVVVELTLATTIWLRRTWWLALPLGLGLHAGVELVGLEIGLFSYLVMALYLLVVPDRVYHALDRATRRLVARLRARRSAWLVVGGAGTLAGAIAFLLIPLPVLVVPLVVALVVIAVVVVGALRRRDHGGAGRALTALAIALAVPAVLARTTDTVLDHHRYRAGAARRLGDVASARAAYRDMLAVDPSSEYAHYYLATLDLDAGDVEAALAHFHAAEKAAPLAARSFVAEAKLVFAKGELARAQAILRDALAADPEDKDALALEKSWSTMTPAEAPPAPKPPVPAEAPPVPKPPVPAEAPPAPKPPVPAEAPPAPTADGAAGGR